MSSPSLHRQVAIWKGKVAGGLPSYAMLAVAAFFLAIVYLFEPGLLTSAVFVAIAAGFVLAAVGTRRVVVRMDLYTVQIRNVLLPGAGRRVAMRSIRSAEIVVPSESDAGVLRWVPGSKWFMVHRMGPALELELTSGRRYVFGMDQPYRAFASLRRFRNEAMGNTDPDVDEINEEEYSEEELFLLWRRNRPMARPAARPAAPKQGVRPGTPKAAPKPAGAKAATRQAQAKAHATQQASAKANAARQNAAKANAARQAAAKQNAARQAAARQAAQRAGRR